MARIFSFVAQGSTVCESWLRCGRALSADPPRSSAPSRGPQCFVRCGALAGGVAPMADALRSSSSVMVPWAHISIKVHVGIISQIFEKLQEHLAVEI